MTNKKPFSIRLSELRIEKLKRISEAREKTMTQLIEDMIDTMPEQVRGSV